MRSLTSCLSDICWLHFEHPFRVPSVSLAELGLQGPAGGHQLCPGFFTQRVARGTPHASTNNISDVGTLGRYSKEDGCGTQFNGSVLHVPSHRTWPCAALDHIAHKNTSGRLSCRRSFVRYSCNFTRLENPVRSAVKAGSKRTEILHVLPDVSVVTWLS